MLAVRNECVFSDSFVGRKGLTCGKETESDNMEMNLQQELVEAGLRLRKASVRVVNETPECFTHKNSKWCVEFRNPISGECLTVTYYQQPNTETQGLQN